MSYEYVSVDGQSRKKSRTSRGNGAQTKATLLEHLECIDSVERPQIGIHVPLWTGWPATTTPGIATRRFPPAVILCTVWVKSG